MIARQAAATAARGAWPWAKRDERGFVAAAAAVERAVHPGHRGRAWAAVRADSAVATSQDAHHAVVPLLSKLEILGGIYDAG